MMARRLSAFWPHHPLLLSGAGGLAIALVALQAVTPDDPNPLLIFATTASWLVAGGLLGWHLKALHRWPAAPLIPRFLVAHAVGHLVLMAGLWLAWWLILRPPAPTALLSLLAAGLGVCWPFIPSVVGLGGSVLVLVAASSTKVQPWLGSQAANLAMTGFSVLVLLVVLVQITRVEQPAIQKPLRWFWLGILLDRNKPPKPIAESLARAMRVGARQSWILAGVILAFTALVSLITFIRPETRPSLLAMLFPAWMGGILAMPILVHLNSVRSLDRLWLTGAFNTRRSFAHAVITANVKHIQRMNLTAMILLLGVIFVDGDVGIDGMSLVFLLFGASVALLALTVWTTQRHTRRLPIAIFVAATIVSAMLASYAVLVNDLLFDEPIVQMTVCVGISLAAQVVGIRWAGYMLSQQSFSVGTSAPARITTT